MAEQVPQKPAPVDSGAQQADVAALTEQAKAKKAEAKAAREVEKEQSQQQATTAAHEQQEDVQASEPDDGESAGDETEQQVETNPGKKNTPRGVQKKLDKLTREKYEAMQQAAYWQQQAQQAQQPNQANQKPATVEGKPTLAGCENDPEKYLEAMAEWKANQIIEGREKQRVQREEVAKKAQVVATHRSREQAFAQAHPDYYDTAYTAPINFSEPMLDYITSSEKGPEVAYYLAQHLDEAKAIEQMPPHRQGIALDKIERGFAEPVATDEMPVERPARTVTQAPPPPATIAPSGNAKRDIYDDSLSPKERIAMWKRQQAQQRA